MSVNACSRGHFSRRDLLRLAAAASTPSASAQSRHESADGVHPFKVSVKQATINRIMSRIRDTRWPDRMEADDWRYGANWDYMKSLVRYWTTQFDWRQSEKNLNRYPQFLARVEDCDIHFYHVKGRGPKPLPLILTHGWPGSVFEFLETIGPLSDPASYGGSPNDAFDVIVPSLPGYGFSSKPKKVIGAPTTAALWHKLLTGVLGYIKYGAQGGDLGSGVTSNLGLMYPSSVVGIHLNGARGSAPPESHQSPEEREWQRASAAYTATERDYFGEQQHKPQTMSFALADNPLGTAAWIVEKMKSWSDSSDSKPVFTHDQILTNVMIYLVTDTVGSAFWFYRGNLDDRATVQGKPMVPTAIASFPRDLPGLTAPRTVVERNYNLVHYTKMPQGGHFAALEQPQLLVQDLRAFFRTLRA
ncbi:MAG: epoxide hydrolase family protein [Bryobacteraceae bacterium]